MLHSTKNEQNVFLISVLVFAVLFAMLKNHGTNYKSKIIDFLDQQNLIKRYKLSSMVDQYFVHIISLVTVVSYKRKYVQEVLVNCLFKLAQEKVWLGELTVPP